VAESAVVAVKWANQRRSQVTCFVHQERMRPRTHFGRRLRSVASPIVGERNLKKIGVPPDSVASDLPDGL